MPFKSKDEDTLYDLIKKGELDFSDEVWNEVSSQGTLCLSILFAGYKSAHYTYSAVPL